MTKAEEIEYYRDTLEGGMSVIMEAFGITFAEHYDRDQADGECYMDCFRDAAKVIEKSGYRWNDDEADFLPKPNFTTIKNQLDELTKVINENIDSFKDVLDNGSQRPIKRVVSISDFGKSISSKDVVALHVIRVTGSYSFSLELRDLDAWLLTIGDSNE